MAAPSIPSLSTLRSSRGRGRGRGLGSPVDNFSLRQDTQLDLIIQQTDQDANVSRLSAVQAGYLKDPYATLFVNSEVQRRFPIINRGVTGCIRSEHRG